MFTLSHTTIINIHKEPVDMRLGVYSLQGLIAGSGCSVREGAHYAFTNRPRTLLRTVWFDGTGLCMFSKRRELGGKFLLASYGNYISLRKDGTFERGATDFHGTVLRISIPTGRELDTQDLLRRLSEAGEREASTIRNAFKQASKPSRGLLTELGIDTPPQG